MVRAHRILLALLAGLLAGTTVFAMTTPAIATQVPTTVAGSTTSANTLPTASGDKGPIGSFTYNDA